MSCCNEGIAPSRMKHAAQCRRRVGAGSLPRQDRTYPAPAQVRPPPRARSSAALRRAVPVSAASPHGAWRRFSVGGGCSGGGTEGAASCCLRRLWVHLCHVVASMGCIGSIVRPSCHLRLFGRNHVCLYPLHRWPQTAMAASKGMSHPKLVIQDLMPLLHCFLSSGDVKTLSCPSHSTL